LKEKELELQKQAQQGQMLLVQQQNAAMLEMLKMMNNKK